MYNNKLKGKQNNTVIEPEGKKLLKEFNLESSFLSF